MLDAGLVQHERHAEKTLDLLYQAGVIDPRQEDTIIIGIVNAYRKLRDKGFAPDDVVAALLNVGSAEPTPTYDEVEEYAF